MIARRRVVTSFALVGALSAVLTAGLAQPAAAATDAATVNGAGISHDEFSDALKVLQAPELVPGDPARQVLSVMIENEAIAQELAERGTDTAAALEAAAGNPQDASTALRGLLVEAGLVDTEGLRSEYESTAVAGGWLCAIALVPTEEGFPDEVVEAQADGATFEELIELDGVQAQAISGDMASPCVEASGVPAELAEVISAAAADVGPGAASEPIEVQGLNLIVMVPEFDEVSGVLGATASTDAVAEILADADVSVDPRYGRWDTETLTVVPLGQ